METTSPSRQAMLRLRNVGFRYPGAIDWALCDINLDIYRGEWLLITGPTGCGKSTLLHCLQGLIPREIPGELHGAIELPDADDKETFFRARVGIVFQNFEDQIIAEYVEEEIAFGLESLGLKESEQVERIDEALKISGLSECRVKRVADLSGGQRQRLILASVLAMRPSLILLDEPLSQLDDFAVKNLFDILDSVRRNRQCTIVITEHRLDHAVSMATRRVHMEGGKIVPVGDVMNNTPQRILKVEKEKLNGLHSVEEETTILKVENLSFSYDNQNSILSNVSLKISPKSTIALLGENGAGKSTFLQIVAGFIEPVSGRLIWKNHPLSAARKANPFLVGYMMQNPDLMLFEDTVEKEILFGALRAGMPHDDSREAVADIIAGLGLKGLEDRPPLALSRGQRLRTALASILVFRPSILLLDEPTTGQDWQGIQSIMKYILNLEYIKVFIFCTHECAIACRYAEEIYTIVNGKIQFREGTS